MSSPTKNNPVNLYGLLNQEMDRMHSLLLALMATKIPVDHSRRYHPLDEHQIFARIQEMQSFVLKAIEAHDPVIQEKVAELALTGVNVSSSSDEIPF